MAEVFEVMRFRQGWAVLNRTTKERESGFYSGRPLAEVRCDAMNREEALRRRRKTRACLCCGRSFLSEGNHNRMCDRCRRRSHEFNPAMVEHPVGGI